VEISAVSFSFSHTLFCAHRSRLRCPTAAYEAISGSAKWEIPVMAPELIRRPYSRQLGYRVPASACHFKAQMTFRAQLWRSNRGTPRGPTEGFSFSPDPGQDAESPLSALRRRLE